MVLKGVVYQNKLWGYYVYSKAKGDLFIPIALWLKYGDVVKDAQVCVCDDAAMEKVVPLKDCRVIKGVVNNYFKSIGVGNQKPNKVATNTPKIAKSSIVLSSSIPMSVELNSVSITPNGITYDVRIQCLNRGMLDIFKKYVHRNDCAGYLTDCIDDCDNSLIMDLPILNTDFKDVELLKFFRAYKVKVFIDDSKGLKVNYEGVNGSKFKDILKRCTLSNSIGKYGSNAVYMHQGLYDFYNPKGDGRVTTYEGYIDSILRLVKNKVIEWQ